MSHRPDQLDYQAALARKLLIGSGEIESAHRYIVQQRLKRRGRGGLRINRANRHWDAYWDENGRQAA